MFPVFDSDPSTNELENIDLAPLRSLNHSLYRSLTDSLKFLADFEVPYQTPKLHVGPTRNYVKNISDVTLLVARILPLSRACIFTEKSESEMHKSDNNFDSKIDELHRTDSFVVNLFECTRDDISKVSTIKQGPHKDGEEKLSERQRARQVVLIVRKFKKRLWQYISVVLHEVSTGTSQISLVSSNNFERLEKRVEVTMANATLLREIQLHLVGLYKRLYRIIKIAAMTWKMTEQCF